MDILITGGAGFVGSHLCRTFEDTNYSITILDNFSRFPDRVNRMDPTRTTHADLLDRVTLSEINRNYDWIIHLAGVSSVEGSIANPRPTNDNNVVATQNILDVARKLDSNFVFASSWMVYDKQEAERRGQCSETASLRPGTPYGLSKLIGEQYCGLYSELYGLSTTILRLSNVYGPGDKDRFVPTIAKRAINNQPISIYEKKLNFVYVTDVVRAILCVLKSNPRGCERFNVGTSDSSSLMDMAHMITGYCESLSTVQLLEPKSHEFKFFQPNISKARSALSFNPIVGLEQGLRLTVESLKGERDSSPALVPRVES